ncbi:SusC/RagA family TonB-linked outer membrane protein [Catalinimonas niigatensis]|uniref:SusC/RagA family TonB-linked outer membrane protein n=1 Tax=Catalinimonas niigatensis TaxID=1397264 RepID=UPI0026653AD6|nr:TonB-dependent receptor [Catalinimonas niigatensis]WPP51895.1 TonB-dependent receptor [Catalinimonas niigatensis]
MTKRLRNLREKTVGITRQPEVWEKITSFLPKLPAPPFVGIMALCLFFLFSWKESSAYNLSPEKSKANDAIDITGKVTSEEDGEALPGVNILVKGTTIGTVTDVDGNYRINVPDNNAMLVFTSIGFVSEEIAVNNRTEINVQMLPDIKSLSEVVVVGYGTQKKSDLTGAVTSLRSEDFNQGVVTSVDQMIAGKAAGVQVVQNSAEPGGGISINIRGSGSINAGNSPLYVIDGLPIDNSAAVAGVGERFTTSRTTRNPLAALNPADIESIEILKDASATAIYGARGANGVILITTKNGTAGRFKVNYNGYYGAQNIANKIQLLNPEQYRDVMNDIIDEGGGTPDQLVTDIQNGGTDWQDEIYRSSAPVQDHNLSFSGGNEDTQYLLSLNYFSQDGVVKSSSFERYGARLNLRHSEGERFNVGVNLNTNYIRDDFVPFGYALNEHSGAIYAAYNYDPTLSVRDSEGNYTQSRQINVDNPLALVYGKDAISNTYRTFGNVYGEYFILPELSAKINIGGDISNQQRNVYIDRSTIDGFAAGGIGTILSGKKANYLIEGTLSYNKTINNHSISGVLGVTTQKFTTERFSAESRSFPSDATQTYNLELGDPNLDVVTSGKADNRLLSYLGRINYVFQDKYLFTASFRADGSSRFGANNKFGYFPSLALGWKLHEEGFFGSLEEHISTLKVRASWGQTGNQEIGNYQSITTFGTGPLAVFNDTQVATTDPARIANPDLKWETTEQLNVGLDFGILEDRISGGVEWFQKHTYDMLLALPIPRSTGYSSRMTNIGEMKNSGFEFSLTSNNLNGPLSWVSNVALTTVNNEVMDLGGIEQIITGSAGQTSQIGIIEEGQPVYSFYGYQVDGIWQTGDDFDVTMDNVLPGDIKYRDINGDGTVNADDRVILGNSIPDLIWSFGNTFSYKGLELYVFFEGVEGVQMLNQNLVETYFPTGLRRNRYAEPLLNRWTPENPSNVYPSFVRPTAQGEKRVNSTTVEDASYLRLNTVKLSYQLPINTDFISGASVYVTGQNLFTLTDYSGVDPAVNGNGNANFRIDWNPYPLARTYIVGVNLNF